MITDRDQASSLLPARPRIGRLPDPVLDELAADPVVRSGLYGFGTLVAADPPRAVVSAELTVPNAAPEPVASQPPAAASVRLVDLVPAAGFFGYVTGLLKAGNRGLRSRSRKEEDTRR
jgi:hypothetical protein